MATLTRAVQGFNYISELTYRKSGDEMLDMHPNETPELPDLSKPAMKFANAKYVMRSSLVLFIFVMKIEQGS